MAGGWLKLTLTAPPSDGEQVDSSNGPAPGEGALPLSEARFPDFGRQVHGVTTEALAEVAASPQAIEAKAGRDPLDQVLCHLERIADHGAGPEPRVVPAERHVEAWSAAGEVIGSKPLGTGEKVQTLEKGPGTTPSSGVLEGRKGIQEVIREETRIQTSDDGLTPEQAHAEERHQFWLGKREKVLKEHPELENFGFQDRVRPEADSRRAPRDFDAVPSGRRLRVELRKQRAEAVRDEAVLIEWIAARPE